MSDGEEKNSAGKAGAIIVRGEFKAWTGHARLRKEREKLKADGKPVEHLEASDKAFRVFPVPLPDKLRDEFKKRLAGHLASAVVMLMVEALERSDRGETIDLDTERLKPYLTPDSEQQP